MKELESSYIQSIVERFKVPCANMEKPNKFIMPCNDNDPDSKELFSKIQFSLKEHFDVKVIEPKQGCGDLLSCSKIHEDFSFKCLVVDSGKTEKIRDCVKEVLWPIKTDHQTPPLLKEILFLDKDYTPSNFDLSAYGIFIPYKISNRKKAGEIRTHSFNHKPVFYRYRIVEEKINCLSENLKSFLYQLFSNCPNHLFQKSDFRASARTIDEFNIELGISHKPVHELVELARKSESFGQFKSRHENLQKFFLLNDPCTIACEVPLWLEENEMQDYKIFFNTSDTLTGHIDVLRYEKDGKVGIWDYKPGAKSEVDASIQIWLYALMLSIRTGVCLKNIICGYFDEKDCFVLKPAIGNASPGG